MTDELPFPEPQSEEEAQANADFLAQQEQQAAADYVAQQEVLQDAESESQDSTQEVPPEERNYWDADQGLWIDALTGNTFDPDEGMWRSPDDSMVFINDVWVPVTPTTPEEDEALIYYGTQQGSNLSQPDPYLSQTDSYATSEPSPSTDESAPQEDTQPAADDATAASPKDDFGNAWNAVENVWLSPEGNTFDPDEEVWRSADQSLVFVNDVWIPAETVSVGQTAGLASDADTVIADPAAVEQAKRDFLAGQAEVEQAMAVEDQNRTVTPAPNAEQQLINRVADEYVVGAQARLAADFNWPSYLENELISQGYTRNDQGSYVPPAGLSISRADFEAGIQRIQDRFLAEYSEAEKAEGERLNRYISAFIDKQNADTEYELAVAAETPARSPIADIDRPWGSEGTLRGSGLESGNLTSDYSGIFKATVAVLNTDIPGVAPILRAFQDFVGDVAQPTAEPLARIAFSAMTGGPILDAAAYVNLPVIDPLLEARNRALDEAADFAGEAARFVAEGFVPTTVGELVLEFVPGVSTTRGLAGAIGDALASDLGKNLLTTSAEKVAAGLAVTAAKSDADNLLRAGAEGLEKNAILGQEVDAASALLKDTAGLSPGQAVIDAAPSPPSYLPDLEKTIPSSPGFAPEHLVDDVPSFPAPEPPDPLARLDEAAPAPRPNETPGLRQLDETPEARLTENTPEARALEEAPEPRPQEEAQRFDVVDEEPRLRETESTPEPEPRDTALEPRERVDAGPRVDDAPGRTGLNVPEPRPVENRLTVPAYEAVRNELDDLVETAARGLDDTLPSPVDLLARGPGDPFKTDPDLISKLNGVRAAPSNVVKDLAGQTTDVPTPPCVLLSAAGRNDSSLLLSSLVPIAVSLGGYAGGEIADELGLPPELRYLFIVAGGAGAGTLAHGVSRASFAGRVGGTRLGTESTGVNPGRDFSEVGIAEGGIPQAPNELARKQIENLAAAGRRRSEMDEARFSARSADFGPLVIPADKFESLRGASPEDFVHEAVPRGWIAFATKGPGGVEYRNPLHSDQIIRIHPGAGRVPRDWDPRHLGPYAVITLGRGAEEIYIPLAGNPVLQ